LCISNLQQRKSYAYGFSNSRPSVQCTPLKQIKVASAAAQTISNQIKAIQSKSNYFLSYGKPSLACRLVRGTG
jgi:hypothetical protein